MHATANKPTPQTQRTGWSVPFISSGSVSPHHATVGIGSAINVTVLAANNELGPRPVPSACSIGAVNVTSSFAELGNGV